MGCPFPFAIDGFAMTDKTSKTILNSPADLRAILQRAGLSRAAADLVTRGGFAALAYPQQNPERTLEMSIQDLREKRGKVAAQLQALVAKPNFTDADQATYDKLMASIDGIDKDIRRFNDANERIAASSRGAYTGGASASDQEHLDAFKAFLRAPRDMQARLNLETFTPRNTSSGASDPAGGFIIPETIIGPLMTRLANANPFRGMVRIVDVGTRDVVFPLSNANSTTGWVGENATRTGTNEATLMALKPTFGTLYSFVQASEELVADSQFDIGAWFAMEAGNAMGEAEMAAIVSGNGTDKPSGLLRYAPETAADGSRTAGAFRYIPTGAASTLGSAPSDLLISMVYDLKAGYRSRGAWLMNSAVAGEIRKLKDSQGRFLWTDGIAAGEASTLLGYPVRIAESMPGIGAGNFPIMFGDFERGYILCEHGGLRVTVDDNLTSPGLVKWYIRRRLGGGVFDNNAVRVLKVATS